MVGLCIVVAAVWLCRHHHVHSQCNTGVYIRPTMCTHHVYPKITTTHVYQVGRSHLGLQVYAFGPISIVMDNANSSLLAQRGTSWVPVSLEGLLREVQERGPPR